MASGVATHPAESSGNHRVLLVFTGIIDYRVSHNTHAPKLICDVFCNRGDAYAYRHAACRVEK